MAKQQPGQPNLRALEKVLKDLEAFREKQKEAAAKADQYVKDRCDMMRYHIDEMRRKLGWG